MVIAVAWVPAVVQVQSLAQELPHAMRTAKKKKEGWVRFVTLGLSSQVVKTG